MTDIADILQLDDAHHHAVKVPEWNGVEVMVYSMTARERADIERLWSEKKAASDPGLFRVELLKRTLKKSDGTPWGTEEQFMKLLDKNAGAVERLFEAACSINGFTDRDVEDLAKN